MITIILNTAVGIFQMTIFSYFAATFFQYRERTKKFRYLIYLLSHVVIELAYEFGTGYLNFAASIVMVFLLVIILYQSNPASAFVVTIIGILIALSSESLIHMLFRDLGNIALPKGDTIQLQNQIITTMGVSVLFVISYILRIFITSHKNHGRTIKLRTSIVSFLFIIVSLFIFYYINTVDKLLYDNDKIVSMGTGLFVCMILFNIYILFVTEQEQERAELKQEITAMKFQEEQTSALVRQHEAYVERIQVAAHDMKNHLLVIKGIALTNEPNGMLAETDKYIDELVQTLSSTANLDSIENPALRVILEKISFECENNGISFTTRIAYSDFGFMNFKDISAFFANALDNAVEACCEIKNENEKFITLSIYYQNSIVVVEIKNSRINPIKENRSGILSTKNGSSHYGIGTKNMKRVVANYGGDLIFNHGEYHFEVIATFNMP